MYTLTCMHTQFALSRRTSIPVSKQTSNIRIFNSILPEYALSSNQYSPIFALYPPPSSRFSRTMLNKFYPQFFNLFLFSLFSHPTFYADFVTTLCFQCNERKLHRWSQTARYLCPMVGMTTGSSHHLGTVQLV